MFYKLLKNSFFLYLSQGINLIFPLLIVPFLIERISIEGFGIITLVQVIMSYGNTLVDFGYNMIGVKEVRISETKFQIESILSEALFIKFILLVFSVFLIFFSGFFITNLIGEWELLIFGWLGIVGYTFYPVWYFQGIEKMYLISIINISSKLVVFCLILLFVTDNSHLNLVMLILSMGLIINALLGWTIIFLSHKIKLKKISINKVKESFKKGKDILFSNLIVQVYSNIVIVFSSGLLSPRDIGVLGVYLKLRDIAQSIVGPIQQAVFPTISQFVYSNNIKKLRKLTFNTILILSSIMLIYFLVLMTFFNTINKIMFDNQTSINELFWFGSILCFIYYGGVYTKVIVSFNKMKWVLNSTIVSGLLTISFSYYLMDKFGIIGAIWMIALSYFFNSFLGYFYYRRLVVVKD